MKVGDKFLESLAVFAVAGDETGAGGANHGARVLRYLVADSFL